ncbi:hypothetical protein V8D89_014379 [Ganoderma adspersum]
MQGKECQKKHWREGHKQLCNAQKVFRDRSVQQSGNPNAWSDLMQWVKFHHPTIVNAALACYIRKKHTVPDVTSQYLLQLSLNYRNDPSLPAEMQFVVAATHFTPRDGPFASQVYEYIFEQRFAATELGRMEMGERLYWGTGAYLLMHADARPACRDPIEQLEQNIMEGRKMKKTCCVKLQV